MAPSNLNPSESQYELWDSAEEFPHIDRIPLPDQITHIVVARGAQENYHYLHETSLAMHLGVLHVGWANSREKETNVADELYRTRYSRDGGRTWSSTGVIAPGGENIAHNHGVMAARQDELWTLVARHDEKKLTGMEGFVLDESEMTWHSSGIVARGFIPFDRPQHMPNGNWLVAGETGFHDGSPAVAISNGGDFHHWQVVPIPVSGDMPIRFPETTVMPTSDGRLIAIIRYEDRGAPWNEIGATHPHNLWALVSVSEDNGQAWTPATVSNMPLHPSKPFAGRLSTGEGFLIFNVPHPDIPAYGRHTLAIAITRPGEPTFCRVWRIRHGQSPVTEFTQHPQWSYPFAIEHEDNLYISYTINKSDCGLSVIPAEALRAM